MKLKESKRTLSFSINENGNISNLYFNSRNKHPPFLPHINAEIQTVLYVIHCALQLQA